MIGAGEGKHDVPFINQCAANVRKLVAVEPDHQSVEGLRVRLDRDLPGVECQVIETRIQSWKGPDDPVDLVLMMNVLYYVSRSERNELFQKVQEQWLNAGGFAIVVYASHTECRGNGCEIFKRLGSPMTPFEDIETELMEAGFIKKYVQEMQHTTDYSNPDESFLRFFQRLIDHPVTLDDVRSVMEELYPDGKADHEFYTIVVLQRA